MLNIEKNKNIEKLFRAIIKYLEFLDIVLPTATITPNLDKDTLQIGIHIPRERMIWNEEKQKYDAKTDTHYITIDIKYNFLEED